ncbi:DUF397 domain-containing protein [Streptomyces sp. 4F14]|uniref:DUF397 domain-containing protein n=1 Tax=Streptomyces sp. 4F14 TaxID=3394380 RepID=UPI003A87F06C
MPAGPTLAWFKSSYSGGNTTECVECAGTGHGTLVRDSKQPDTAVIAVRKQAWSSFITALRG